MTNIEAVSAGRRVRSTIVASSPIPDGGFRTELTIGTVGAAIASEGISRAGRPTGVSPNRSSSLGCREFDVPASTSVSEIEKAFVRSEVRMPATFRSVSRNSSAV